MPRTDVTDEQFEKFLSEGNVSVTAETPNKLTFPMRSTKPNDLNHIRHCIAFNIVMCGILA
ncbi:unnamed protein product [Anisakis simplex]|uniref:MSP domain-containing protein n=1 Tax=Anisakis simplex TaxID=6269 RepID=A0A0M3JMG9_ANISI|nr:unnamed protein product [Anisakis simplex]